jgi:hypothetical protein
VDLSSGHGISVSLDGKGHSTTSLLGLPIFANQGGKQDGEEKGAVVAVLMLQVRAHVQRTWNQSDCR